MAKILVIEDNLETLDAIKNLLQSDRHTVDCVETADEAVDFVKTYQYDVLVVDWEMPGMPGTDFIKKYRDSGGKAPVLMLTGKSSTPDKICGLDCGADYYLTKPLDAVELLGFIRAGMRRPAVPEEEVIRFADLELRPESALAACGEKSVTLTSKEISVLRLLMENSKRLITHDELKNAGWADDPDVAPGSIRVFLSALREKVQSVGAGIRILSVRGYGYRIE